MGWPQTVSGVLLVVVLLSVSLFYGWRQLRALRAFRHKPDLPAEEASHDRRQAWRRSWEASSAGRSGRCRKARRARSWRQP